MQRPKAILLLLLISVTGRLSAQPVQKVFSDWELSCNNFASCEARSIDHGSGLVVSFYRRAGESTIDWLRIDYHPPNASAKASQSTLVQRLMIDDHPWPQPDLQSDPRSVVTDDPRMAQSLLDLLSHSIKLSVGDDVHATLSLTTLPEFLRKVSEIRANLSNSTQGQEDSSQTLVVESGLTPPTPLSRDEINYFVNYGISQISLQTCSLEPVFRQIKVAPVSDTRALLLISCESAAYNTFYQAWLINRNSPPEARQLTFRLPFSQEVQTGDNFELTNAGYDPTTRVLTTVLWGRYLADCGTLSRWQFDGQQFVLKQFASESVCDRWHSADRWPVIWSAVPEQAPDSAGNHF
ncbi:hypothetical protein HA49_17160 [Tatumella morbirosei]|uniref:DUF1176 domain-containing protein n=1 Tax=Tatumella morbirosei TaxID=642227 RepID=A0A095T7C3_9GAMM|nr:DUF1176 domain-containing protein [Tatumella morbirosei]KGD72444.1 hypothetical protein HA49_17160 [Tatumella morbirosei]